MGIWTRRRNAAQRMPMPSLPHRPWKIHGIEHHIAVIAGQMHGTHVWIGSWTDRRWTATLPIDQVCFVQWIQTDLLLTISRTGMVQIWTSQKQSSADWSLVNQWNTDAGIETCLLTFLDMTQCWLLVCGYQNGKTKSIQFTNEWELMLQIEIAHQVKDWICSIEVMPELGLILIGSWDSFVRAYDFDGNLQKAVKTQSVPLCIKSLHSTSWAIGGYDGSVAIYSF
jgi:hypothetical protein